MIIAYFTEVPCFSGSSQGEQVLCQFSFVYVCRFYFLLPSVSVKCALCPVLRLCLIVTETEVFTPSLKRTLNESETCLLKGTLIIPRTFFK